MQGLTAGTGCGMIVWHDGDSTSTLLLDCSPSGAKERMSPCAVAAIPLSSKKKANAAERVLNVVAEERRGAEAEVRDHAHGHVPLDPHAVHAHPQEDEAQLEDELQRKVLHLRREVEAHLEDEEDHEVQAEDHEVEDDPVVRGEPLERPSSEE